MRSAFEIVQNASAALVRNVVFPVWAMRDHPHCARYLQEFSGSQYYKPAQLRELQTKRLISLLAHAYANCAFYRKRMDAVGFDPYCADPVHKIDQLPVLTKQDIQNHGPELLAEGCPPEERVKNQTGGSTGSPLQFYVDKERFDSRMASTWRHNLWAGYRPGDWSAHLWGARLDQVVHSGWWDWCRNNFLHRRIELNTSTISAADWSRFTSTVRGKRPPVLLAYAQSAVLYAQYLREQGINDVEFRSIITTAEVLLPDQRVLLEQTFRGKVFNRYGCREMSVIASECDQHDGLHVNADALYVELVPDRSIPQPFGKIVVTDLLNRSMPLIRYEIGDVARWSEGAACPCGRGLPLLAEIQGRTTDFISLADGRKISGPALTLVVADMPDVRQVQFVQRSSTDIVLRVVAGNGFGEHTKQELRRRLDLYLQGQASIEIEEAEIIRSESSGKYRFVINEIGRGTGAAH